MIQKVLKTEDEIVVLADFREEKNFVIEYLQKFGAKVKLISLKVGDFICSDRICIERKASNDFVSSIIDGRIFRQAEELRDNFEKPVLLIEGNNFREGMNENAIKGAIASLLLDFNIPVLATRDDEDTAKTIYWLAKREQVVSKRPIGIKGTKKPKDFKKLQERIISSFPGLSSILSKKILGKFKTIKNFSNAEESQLVKVDGIGKVSAKKLYDLLNKEYEGD